MTTEPMPSTNAYIKKKLVHDILPCNEWRKFMGVLGLIPASDEVEELEHRASHHRLNRTKPVAESIATLSGLSGEIIARSILESHGIEPDERIVETYKMVAHQATQAVIANMIELNLLHLGGHP